MLARLATFAIDGVDPRQVWVEVDIRSGLPGFTVVGLGDTAVRESRDRVRAAIQNSGFNFPKTRITANLAPAFLRKVGPGFDAALALGVLAASGQVPAEAL
ncbi:MAG TPA: magnesium chelatase domain-containing protein, partial [Solirubrobacteraceae bacterium]|nr:magnesium chelatase domain-containing protein [Solirubrobacteraceae bacterium]